MRIQKEPKELSAGAVEPAHTVEQLCENCGYDLDESEISADACADCGATLNLRQNVAIQVTTLPSIFGDSM